MVDFLLTKFPNRWKFSVFDGLIQEKFKFKKEVLVMKLSIKSFALTCGIFSGFGLFLVTWWKIISKGASGNATFIGNVLCGYNISPLGSVIGLVWGLVVGLITGAIFAWLYNRLSAVKSS